MDGGMLSQDEINALLSGMDISGGGDEGAPAEGSPDTGEVFCRATPLQEKSMNLF